MRHILIADDEKEIADLISIYLRNEGFQVTRAANGREALELLAQEDSRFDLLILDIMMPEVDGLEVCRRVRDMRMLPILMLSAKSEDMDKVMGLMTGADDYLTKPFNPLELTARVKSLLRRSFQYNAELRPEEGNVVRLNGLEIDKDSHRVTADGKEIALTSTEFEILYLLAKNTGRVFSAEDIFLKVWKEKYYASNNTVMVHMSHLRDKLEKELGYKLIHTVWGVGYKIDA